MSLIPFSSYWPMSPHHALRPWNYVNDFWQMADRFQREMMMPFSEFDFNEPFLDFESSVRKVHKSQALTLTDNSFDVKLDVSKFSPSEINVKVHDNNALIIEGKHEETGDPDHYISRHFVRRFHIPEGVIMQDMKSKYSADGQLEIHAPREIVKPPPAIASDTHIPITFVGKEAIERKVDGA